MHPMVVICPSTLPTISSIRQVSFLRIPAISLLLLYVVLDLANLVGILIPPLYLVGVLLFLILLLPMLPLNLMAARRAQSLLQPPCETWLKGILLSLGTWMIVL